MAPVLDPIRRSLAAQRNFALEDAGLLVNDGHAPEPAPEEISPELLARQQAEIRRRGLADDQVFGDTDESEGGLLGSIGSGLLSGIGMAANVLDLPASTVRDLLTGNNPLDQWMHPFTGGLRASGRDLTSTYGLTSPNKETGWVPLEDPGEFVQDAVGFAAELATDPLAWLTGWAHAARAAKAARAGQPIRQAGAIRRLGDTVDFLDPGHQLGQAAYRNPSIRRGVRRGAVMSRRRGRQLGGAAAATRAGQRVADVYDQTVDPWVQNRRRDWNEMFDQRVRSATTGEGQASARVVSQTEHDLDRVWRSQVVPVLSEIMDIRAARGADAQVIVDELSRDMRRALEDPEDIITAARLDPLPTDLHRPLQQLKDYQNVILQEARRRHINIDELQDEMVGYLHRQMNEQLKRWSGEVDPNFMGRRGGKAQAVTSKEHQGHRAEIFRGIETDDVNDIVSDSYAQGLLERGTPTEEGGSVIEEVAEYIRRRYGHRFNEQMPVVNRTTGAFRMLQRYDPRVDDVVHWGNNRAGVVEELTEINGAPAVKIEDVADPVPVEQLRESKGKMVDLPRHEMGELDKYHDAGDEVTWGDGLSGIVEEVNEVDGVPVVTVRTGDDAREFVNQADLSASKFQRSWTYDYGDGNIETVQEILEGQYTSRAQALAEHMNRHPEYEYTGGLYTNMLHAVQSGFRAATTAISNAAGTTHTIRNGFDTGVLQMPGSPREYLPGRISRRGERMTLGDFFGDQSMSVMDRGGVYDELLENSEALRNQINSVAPDALEIAEDGTWNVANRAAVNNWIDRVEFAEPEVAQDLLRSWQFHGATPDSPGAMGAISNTFRSMTALFKAGVLTAPARYHRDVVSGQIQNMTHGIWSWKSFRSGYKALFNQADETLMDIPEVVQYMQRRGFEMTGANATKALREMYTARRGHASSIYRDVDFVDTSLEAAQDFESMSHAFPGGTSGFFNLMRESAATLAGRRPGGSWDFRDIAGFNRRRRTAFNPVRAGDIIGKHADDMNRLPGFIESMRRGSTADEAMDIVERVQLNYDPRTFTPTEQQLKKAFPFYSFFSRELRYLGNELMQNPTGRLGKLIRLQGKAEPGDDEDQYVPEYIREQMAFPLRRSKDGGQNYLTGVGLMHEDPLTTVIGGLSSPQRGIRELLSKSNPLIKGPVEWGLGRSSFQGGPLGGRDITDMDPTMGRILTQLGDYSERFTGTRLGLREPAPSGLARPFISRGAEFVASNSPLSRVLSSTKTALDDRKSLIERAVNLTTGLRVSTVSPEQSRRALRDIGNAIARDAGARPFQTFHISKDLIEDLRKRDPEAADQLEVIRRQRDQWNKERRAEIRRRKSESAE